jgi:hypothetical protein
MTEVVTLRIGDDVSTGHACGQVKLAETQFMRGLDAEEAYLIQRFGLCPNGCLRKWLFRVMRPNMPLHIVLARHALRARDHRAGVLLL